MDGFSVALSEITLVLFTTLAPSGAVAYLLMSLPVLSGRAAGDTARRLNQLTCLPLLVAMVGLVASATHLGNPANALYVFTGVGRSPLSTEVFAAVIFLALAGVYWLYSFAEHPRVGLQRGLLAAIDVAIVAFVSSVAFAYNVDTIVTWSLPLVPASLILNALFGGPLLALAGFALASRGLGAAEPAKLTRTSPGLWPTRKRTPPKTGCAKCPTSLPYSSKSLLPSTAVTGARVSNSRRMAGPQMSPAWMMWSQSASAA